MDSRDGRQSETMCPGERYLGTIRGRIADRVPLHLIRLHFRTPEDVAALADPLAREIADRIFPHVHYDVHVDSLVNRFLITPRQRMKMVSRQEGNGRVITTSRIETPKGPLTFVDGRSDGTDTSWMVKYPVESPEDIERLLSIPWELPQGLAAPRRSELPADVGTRGFVYTRISSPFVCVAGAMQYERFLELCLTDMPLLRELAAVCLDRTLAILDVLLSGGVIEYVWVGGSEWVTPPMASPWVYDELVQEFERPVIDRIHAAGAIAHVHCHGRVADSIEKVIRRGGDLLEPVEPPPDGDITMAEAKRIAAGRITLAGNVESRILENENADAVEAAVRAAFDGGKHRFILQPTEGPIGKFTRRMSENYHRMIDVWEELSPIL